MILEYALCEVISLNRVEKIKLKRYNFYSKDVPPEFENVKIVFLSDIHHGKCFSTEKLRRLVEMTNNLNPDLILLGGDYVDRDPNRIPSFFREAAAFRAPLGVMGVLGNHDRWTDGELSERCMYESGITLLDNRAVWVERGGSRIRVGGVGDLTTSNQDLAPMLEGTKDDDLMILVTHHPNYVDKLPKDKIDLILCGHTHGGQISFRGKWVPHWPGEEKLKYITGVVKKGSTTIIVSNGIGTVGPPIRIWAAPQIWEIVLKKA
ncbi:metallophosphoesterase [[Clostridium] cellulosi]|jgi:Calcineurin-like phosphoesterase.|uniref:Metallophosphoesterase n=1 Tax=[Clostridium] cellulosi TaxID=29343 RepID=A0A078KPT4_9FIRM|nr:metallophosphoesterase [[Clostridium] cellulosi]